MVEVKGFPGAFCFVEAVRELIDDRLDARFETEERGFREVGGYGCSTNAVEVVVDSGET